MIHDCWSLCTYVCSGNNNDDNDESYSIHHWTDVPAAGAVCVVPSSIIAGSTFWPGTFLAREI